MNKIATLIALIMLPILAATAVAGVEPSPFRPEANRLGSVANGLSAVNQSVNAALTRMGIEPSPFRSWFLVNRLEAADNHLGVLLNRLERVLAALPPGIPAEDGEVNAALLEVKAGAEEIMQAAEAPVGDATPEAVVDAMEAVYTSAREIKQRVEESLNLLN